MRTTTYNPPTKEVLEKIRLSREAVRGTNSKEIRCPICGRLLIKKYPDVTGHIDSKCDKCGNVMVVDLVSWRRAGRR